LLLGQLKFCNTSTMAALLWTQKQDIGPGARHSFELAYDIARGRVVCFGGQTGQALAGDTWEWDGEIWTQMSDIGPSPRMGYAMAYDAARHCVVLFGGAAIIGNGEDQPVLGDTWEWDGENWTQVADTGPAARYFHAMTYDDKRQRILLFGGAMGMGRQIVNFADTWSWDGNQWTKEQEAGPAGRNSHKLVYDTIRDRAVLFGGATQAGLNLQNLWQPGDVLNDTWEYNGVVWSQVAHTGPEPRGAYGLIYNGANTLLYGGWDLLLEKFIDTWMWDGKYWTQRQDMGPGGRSSHGMAYDSSRKRTVLFGGNDEQSMDLGDTWEAFERPLPTSAPTAPPK
jgi:hypothetical protein